MTHRVCGFLFTFGFLSAAQAQPADPAAPASPTSDAVQAPGPAPVSAAPPESERSAAESRPSPPPTSPRPPDADPSPRPGSTPAPAADAVGFPRGKFEFGSYGRVNIASDGRGATGRVANIVAHGTRIDEESYAELELRREDELSNSLRTRVVATLALFPPFFHFTSNIAQQLAVRNLYAQAQIKDVTLWAGSRMYRGDDIYLLNWWPLDNQNTIGGGVGYKFPPETGDTSVALHVGMQRLDNPYQFQTVPALRPFGFGATDVIKLDRPRFIETLKFTHLIRNPGKPSGFKVIGYGELHELAAGVQRDPATNRDRPLPGDVGFVLGSELAYWTGQRDTFIQLFLRHARNIAAYDPLQSPTTFANDRSTQGSSDTVLALGGNYEVGAFGLQVGAYLRFFRDGDSSDASVEKFDEGTLVARPQLYIGEHWGLAVEGSYQARRFQVSDPTTDEALSAGLFRFGVIPYFSPTGRGSFKRPQFRLLYALTSRDSGARRLYPTEDVFSQRPTEHFIGLGVEWWFNSSSYP